MSRFSKNLGICVAFATLCMVGCSDDKNDGPASQPQPQECTQEQQDACQEGEVLDANCNCVPEGTAECDADEKAACEEANGTFDDASCKCIKECTQEQKDACQEGEKLDEDCNCVPEGSGECDADEKAACEADGGTYNDDDCSCTPKQECDASKKSECEGKGGTFNDDDCTCALEEKCTAEKNDECADKGQTCNPDTGECEGGQTCDSGQELCDNSCVDLSSDKHNCGSCGNSCKDNWECENKVCVLKCVEPEQACGEGDAKQCVNVQNDKDNCGSCGNKCSEGSCVDGTCSNPCTDAGHAGDADYEVCDGQCVNKTVDYASSVANCGKCGNACEGNEKCVEGTCKKDELDCASEGKEKCGEECINVMGDDVNNCGSCGKKCEDGLICRDGDCVSVCGEKTQCGVDDSNNPICYDLSGGEKVKVVGEDGTEVEKLLCGGCDKSCEDGLKCSKGECVKDCGEGEILCGGACVNAKENLNFCGASGDCEGDNKGKQCASNGVCSDGECGCPEGQIGCGINEGVLTCVKKDSSVYCGCDEASAGFTCEKLPNVASSSGCVENKCVITSCKEGYADCDGDFKNGCEVNINEDPNNCNGCTGEKDYKCPTENVETAMCTLGECHPVCKENFTACGAECVNLKTGTDDGKNNCGACGATCGDGFSCQEGVCVIDASACKDGKIASVTIEKCKFEEEGGKRVWKCKNENITDVNCITNKEEFMAFHDAVNKGESAAIKGKYVLVNKDPIEIDADPWIPIGNKKANAFKGVFLGNGKSIKAAGDEIKYDTASTSIHHGLFGYISGAFLDGIIIDYSLVPKDGEALESVNLSYTGGLVGYAEESYIRRSKLATKRSVTGYNNVGGLIGQARDSVIDGCSSTGAVTSTIHQLPATVFTGTTIEAATGGLIGSMNGTTLRNSSAAATITTGYLTHRIGGLVGLASNSSYVADCTATVDLKAKGPSVGGLIGRIEFSDVENSHATGTVNALTDENKGWSSIGGLIGSTNSVSNINGCSFKGKVSGRYYVGGLVGYLGQNGRVDGCKAEDVEVKGISYDTSSVGQYVGGLVGYSVSADIFRSTSTGKVRADYRYGGGLVGIFITGNMDDCSSSASVKGSFSGGLIGEAQSSTVSNSFSTGAVTGVKYDAEDETNKTKNAHYIGGLVGRLAGSSLNNCYSTGDVSNVDSYIGGLVGEATTQSSAASNINTCYATGSVEAKSNYVGGLVGHLVGTNISNSYVTGDVTNVTCYTGGLVGLLDNSTVEVSKITNSYFDAKVNGTCDVGGIVGRVASSNVKIDKCYTTSKAQIKGSTNDIGGIVGYVTSEYAPEISNCTVAGTVYADVHYVGGIAGIAGAANIHDCSSSASVTSRTGNYVGGLIGHGTKTKISNCSTTSRVKGGTESNGNYVGGLIGYLTYGTVENSSVAVDTLYARSSYVGGFAGYTTNAPVFKNNTVYISTSLTSGSYTGGFIGHDNAGTTIENCAVVVNKITGGERVAGLVGNGVNTVLKNNTVIANVNGTSNYIGGLVGYTNGLTIHNCYAYGKIDENTGNSGAVLGGATTATRTINGAYWWDEALKGKRSMPSSLVLDANAPMYKMVENVATYSDSPLAVALGEGWGMAKCSVFGGEQTLPVRTDKIPSVCKIAD